MDLGLAILLSTVIISLILLFNFTKDRWNWKKILLILGISILTIALALGIWYFNITHVDYQCPGTITIFWDISLGSSKDDVKFLKGEPSKIDGGNWEYNTGVYEYEMYRVNIYDNKVSSIIYFCGGYYPYTADKLCGRMFIGYNLQSLKDFFGEPTDVNSHKDGIARIYSFKKYQVLFYLKENRVFGYGIYNPQLGSIHF
jgi:hypothetical protein